MRWLGQINSLPPSVGGGTFSKQNYTMLDNLFQSPHKGWDIRLLGDSGALYEFQSTHLQGVGHHRLRPDRQVLRFQSTHPQGVGPGRRGRSHPQPPEFQSTHPQGVGRRASNQLPRRRHFNPPTRKGWDLRMILGDDPGSNFNPPTRKGWDQLLP